MKLIGLAELYRARRGVRDVDPETGEETDEVVRVGDND